MQTCLNPTTRHQADKQNQSLKFKHKPTRKKLPRFYSRNCLSSVLFTLFIQGCSTDYFRRPRIESRNKLAGCLPSRAESPRERTVLTRPANAGFQAASEPPQGSPHSLCPCFSEPGLRVDVWLEGGELEGKSGKII